MTSGNVVLELDWLCTEGLVKLGSEYESECLRSLTVTRVVVCLQKNLLHLILRRTRQVRSLVHHVGGVLTQPFGTVDVSILRVADTSTGLGFVPHVSGEGGGVRLVGIPEVGHEFVADGAEVVVLEVGTSSVTAAVIGTLGALTSLALVAVEALAVAAFSIADASVGALSVLVVQSQLGWLVDPSEVEGTDPLRAVARLTTKSYSVVVVAQTNTVLLTSSMSRTLVVTCVRVHRNEQRYESDHCNK